MPSGEVHISSSNVRTIGMVILNMLNNVNSSKNIVIHEEVGVKDKLRIGSMVMHRDTFKTNKGKNGMMIREGGGRDNDRIIMEIWEKGK